MMNVWMDFKHDFEWSKIMMLILLGSLLGCVTTMVDRFTMDRVVGFGQTLDDTQKPCALGESLSHVLLATKGKNKNPELALLIANGTSAICAQQEAFEEHLREQRYKYHDSIPFTYSVPEAKDAQYAAQRWDVLAAKRFLLAFEHSEAFFGPIGGDCPFIEERNQSAYLIGLISGTFAVLHDKASGGQVGVPMDILPKVARASNCLKNDQWWGVPHALQFGIWATVPGAGLDDVDAWASLKKAADDGSQKGVRVAYAVASLLANNNGEDAFLVEMLRSHGESLDNVPQNPNWAFFDQYATEIALYQSDLLWTKKKGYRTPKLGMIPPNEEIENTQSNPEIDPFD